MAVLKDILHKIGAVKKTQQITRAMNMVAAAKLRSTQDRMQRFDPYARKFVEVLENLSGWGEVMSLIRNRDAVCELKFPAASLYRHNEWLNSIDPAYNLHIRIANTRRILLLKKANHKRDGQTLSLNFANAAGHVFWRVYAQSAEAQEQFRHLMEQYGK
jgi:putative heme degradation protein